jgi:ribosomal protein S27AE
MSKIIKMILTIVGVLAFVALAGYVTSQIMQVFVTPFNYLILGSILVLLAVYIVFSLFREPKEKVYVLEKICPECGETLYLTYDLPEDETQPREYYYACDGCEYSEEITRKLF